jgi:hypothetical protein
MKLFQGLIGIVSFMNIFAGIIGGIWLIFLGHWQIPVIGLIAALLATNFLFPLLMLPSFGLAKLSLASLKRGHNANFFVLQALNWLINLSWIAAFVYIGFAIVLSYHHSQNLLPFVLVAYGLIAGPLGEMTIGEEDSDGPTKMIIVLIDAGMIAMSIALLFGLSLAHAFFIFLPFAIFGVIWGMLGAYSAKEENKHLPAVS